MVALRVRRVGLWLAAAVLIGLNGRRLPTQTPSSTGTPML